MAGIFRALHGTLFLFGTDGYGSAEPRVQMVRGYGFHIIVVGAWMVPERLGLLRSGLRSLVKSAVWLGSGLRFQVRFVLNIFGSVSVRFVLNIFLPELRHLPCLQL